MFYRNSYSDIVSDNFSSPPFFIYNLYFLKPRNLDDKETTNVRRFINTIIVFNFIVYLWVSLDFLKRLWYNNEVI